MCLLQRFLGQPEIPVETAVRVYRRYLQLEPTHAEEFIAYLKSKVRCVFHGKHRGLHRTPDKSRHCRLVHSKLWRACWSRHMLGWAWRARANSTLSTGSVGD